MEIKFTTEDLRCNAKVLQIAMHKAIQLQKLLDKNIKKRG